MTRLLIAALPSAAILALAAFLLVSPVLAKECMQASWYGTESGNRTATGDYFDGSSLTAAMPSRKYLGHRYRVTFNGRSVVVRINDIGPAKRTGRGIDLSRAAAARIGLIAPGHGRVCIERM